MEINKKAIIIGGSLGGLFAATTLRAIGWDVEVYERSEHALDSRGGGVVLQPDVLKAFRFGGVNHTAALGVRSGDRIYLDRDDTVIQRSYMPQSQTSWSMLYATLRRHVPSRLIHPGHSLERFEDDGEKVTAYFSNGHVTTGDLLVAADGSRSMVREQLVPGLMPSYAGYVAWRGLVPESMLSAKATAVLADTFAFQQGHEHLMLEYLVPGENESTKPLERRWNWVWYRKVGGGDELQALMTDRTGKKHAFSLPPGSVRDEHLQEMRQASSDLLAPTFNDLVAATEEPFVQAILDFQTPQMAFGRVVLIGDAAFIPRPHTAGSTAKAASNAVVLAKALRRSPQDVGKALLDFAEAEHGDGMRMTQWGMSIGDQIMGIRRPPVNPVQGAWGS